MRKLLATIALSALPLMVQAQYIVQEPAEPQKAMLDRLLSSGPGASSSAYIPIWSAPDGRLLVAVAQSSLPLSPIAPAAPQVGSALDWRLIDATSLLDGRVGVRIGEQSSLQGGISLVPLALSEPGLALDCSSSYLSANGADCRHGVRRAATYLNWYAGNVGGSWSNADFGIDFGLALNWLKPALPRSLVPALNSALPAVSAPGNANLPRLVIPTQDLGRFSDSAQFGARGSWYFGTNQSLDLGASIGRIRLSPDPAGGRALWQQTALSLGVGSNALSTSITGRFHNPLHGLGGAEGQRWTGIDLGLTWHTPWQAELSIGAQNLWSNPPLTGSEANNQARTPYVQYQQDL